MSGPSNTSGHDFKSINEELSHKFSPTFCFAKWYKSFIHLHLGLTNSCHLPPLHSIDISKIQNDPQSLHNTEQKFFERSSMLTGKRNMACGYCWLIEKNSGNFVSPRHLQNALLSSPQRIQAIKEDPFGNNIAPSEVEVTFSNSCQMKCGYCSPAASSKFYSEIQQYGPYKDVSTHSCDIGTLKILGEENNPYIEAFWRWWPELKKSLKVIRLTGGEPLIQKSTSKFLNYLRVNPSPEISLSVNSNLSLPEEVFSSFCDRVSNLHLNKCIENFKLFASIDTWGDQARYVRTGLDLTLFEKNLKYFLSQTDFQLNLMITYNIFSVPRFVDLLKKIVDWRTEFMPKTERAPSRLLLDIVYLHHPDPFSPTMLPKEDFLTYFDEALNFMIEHRAPEILGGFSSLDIEKFQSIKALFQAQMHSTPLLERKYKDFHSFFEQFDRRRELNRWEVFPELGSFFELCKNQQ